MPLEPIAFSPHEAYAANCEKGKPCWAGMLSMHPAGHQPEEWRMKFNRPTEEQIRSRAREIFLQNGSQPGHELDNWLQAEYEMMQSPVKSIPKERFDQLLPPYQVLESLTGEEVEWFAAKRGGLF